MRLDVRGLVHCYQSGSGGAITELAGGSQPQLGSEQLDLVKQLVHGLLVPTDASIDDQVGIELAADDLLIHPIEVDARVTAAVSGGGR